MLDLLFAIAALWSAVGIALWIMLFDEQIVQERFVDLELFGEALYVFPFFTCLGASRLVAVVG